MSVRSALRPGIALCRCPHMAKPALALFLPRTYSIQSSNLGTFRIHQLNLWQRRELQKLSAASTLLSRHFSNTSPRSHATTLHGSPQTSNELLEPVFKSSKRERRRLLRLRKLPLFAKFLTGITAFFIVSLISYETFPPSRHFLLALVRCSRLMKAVCLDILDYKWTFAKRYDQSLTPEELKEARRQDRHACHARSSLRMLEALRTNAGIYVVRETQERGDCRKASSLTPHTLSTRKLDSMWLPCKCCRGSE